MNAATTTRAHNALIDTLTRKDRNQFVSSSVGFEMITGEALCMPGTTLKHAYFPMTGIICQFISVKDCPPLALGVIGNEGMLGVPMILGPHTEPLLASVLEAGFAWRITIQKLNKLLRDSPSFSRALRAYLYTCMLDLSTTVACTRFHEVKPRLARWLLMIEKRAQEDHFILTHQSMADMLGVQRSAITIAASDFQRSELISYSRGVIKIIDRRGLEEVSCGCR